MQKPNLDESYEDDQDDDQIDREIEEDEGCCSSGCMDCLGLSWRDFF